MKLRVRPPEVSALAGVFICYRRADSDGYTLMLYRELVRHFGPALVFRDRDSIGAGVDYRTGVIDRLRSSRVVLVIIGRSWAAATGRDSAEDDWIRREVAEAFTRQLRVIPVLVDGAELPDPAWLPADLAPLANCQWREIRTAADADQLIKDLVAAGPEFAAAHRRRT